MSMGLSLAPNAIGRVLAHGGRITGDELALIAILALPLLILCTLGLERALRGANAWRSARNQERGRV